nr:UBN2 domain-containing protein [Tanacetum cinerariifolium]
MIIYNALPRKEYERIFMCNTAKEIWKTLLITHQGKSQVKDNKIDVLVQQYEQVVIFEDESIDSAFTRFNTIITSLKAIDEESKDLALLSLDELIENLKVRETIIKKDSKIVKAKEERKSLTLKAKRHIVMKNVQLLIVNKKKAETTRTKKVIGNVFDAEIQIILLENVRNHHRTRTKEHSSKVLEVIAMTKIMKRLKTRHVLWLKHLARTMSSPNRLTSSIEDAFSEYVSVVPDYSPASPGKTYSSASNNSTDVIPPTSSNLLLFHDDPYINIMNSYATFTPSPIPIPPLIIKPPSESPEFFLPKELLSPKKQKQNQYFQDYEIGESLHDSTLEQHGKQIK